MSSMLEQAIVDATALREAALKNAEASIIEKYAPEIKTAVDALLEQEVDLENPMDPQEEEATEEEIEVPASFLEGLGGNPEYGESIQLELTLEALEEMARELGPTEEETIEQEAQQEAPPQEGEFVIDEESIASLVEELVVDITPQKSGWAGTPEPLMQYNLELELAHRAATEVREENEQLKKAIEELSESKERLECFNETLKEAVLKMKSTFDEMSVSNAKLLYTNRILSSPSLNERQKEKIVEAISKAGSVDEAKVIHDTLQSTGGTAGKKPMPKSLSEAIKRSSSTVLPRRQPERTADTAIDRLQILAGIKHNK
mgnify:FL=1